MPPDGTNITPAEVRHAAQQVDAARADFALAAVKAESNLRSHSGGWVGDSRRALGTAITELHDHAEALTKRLSNQHTAMHVAANTLEKIDKRNADKVRAAGGSSTSSLNMDTGDSAPQKTYNRGMR